MMTESMGIPSGEEWGTPTITMSDPPQQPDPEQVGEPEQTDNSVREEDGEQDIDQEPEPTPGSV